MTGEEGGGGGGGGGGGAGGGGGDSRTILKVKVAACLHYLIFKIVGR